MYIGSTDTIQIDTNNACEIIAMMATEVGPKQ